MARWYGFSIPRQARQILQVFAFFAFFDRFFVRFGFFWSDFLTLCLNGTFIVGRRASRASLLRQLFKWDSVEILDPSGNNVWTPGMFLKFITIELCLINKFKLNSY